MFHEWQKQAALLEEGTVSKDEYDDWRYRYPELNTYKHFAKIPSQEFSDMLVEELRKK